MALLEVGTGYPYTTVQAAVNAAPSGGTVRCNATGGNVYAEAVLVNNKRIRLVGGVNDLQAITIAGAGAGAAPALQVTGSGGVCVENLSFSNVGSAATYVVELNVAEDWISRCRIDGGGAKRCLEGQFGDNTLLFNGLRGVMPSCPGQVILQHFTCVNMTQQGLQGNVNNLDAKGCLAYNCNNLGYVNRLAAFCCWNAGDDITPPGALSKTLVPLADISFINYGGGNFFLNPGSLVYVPGVDILPFDITGRRRLRAGLDDRIYAGCYDPYPAAPAYLTGASAIRVL